MLKEMMITRKGYRVGSEPSSRDSVYDTIRFEFEELDNDSIALYCREIYGIPYEEGNIDKFINELASYFDLILGTDEIYAVWLTSREGVIENYLNDRDEWIDIYELPEDALALDNMGNEGTLIASAVKPENWRMDSERVLR